MGTFSARIQIALPSGRHTIDALVDTGATHTSIPAHLLSEMDLRRATEREFILADGQRTRRPVVWVTVQLDGQEFPTPCIVAPDESIPLLGAVTLEEAGLGVDPFNRRLVPAPGFLT